MQQVLYAVIAAIIIGLYLRDSGILAKDTNNNNKINNSQQKTGRVLSTPKVEEMKEISLPSASTASASSLNIDNISNGQHSLRILYCTS